MAKNSQLYQLASKHGEIFKRLHNGSLLIENALEGTQGVIDGIYPLDAKRYQFYPDWYLEPEQQVQKVQAFLDLHDVTLLIPKTPYFRQRTPTEVLMLAAYLSGRMCVGGVQRTFDAWLDFIMSSGDHNKQVWEELKTNSQHLRLVDGVERKSGLRWIGFDPCANLDVSAKSCWNNQSKVPVLASAEVLMAKAIFDKWDPNCNLSGYQFFSGRDWDMAPCITTRDVPGQLRVCAYSANVQQPGRSNPDVRELVAA
jgi:hypothetical protein